MSRPAGDAVVLEQALAAVPQGFDQGLDPDVASLSHITLDHIRILFPEIISYRGGLFLAEAFDRAIVDDYVDHSDEPDPLHAVERLLNFVSLSSEAEGFDPRVANAVGEAIAFSWRNWLWQRFEQPIETFLVVEGHDDAGVWFESRAVSVGE